MASRLDLDILFRVPSVASYDLSADRRRIVASWNESGQYELYLLEIGETKPRQITLPPESKVAPRFSPDGHRIAYLQDYQGDENFDILLFDLKSEKSANITPNTPESISPHIRWSPDGKYLAYSSNRSGKFHIYTILSTGGDPQLLHEHDYIDDSPEWSPDGKRIAFTSLVRGQDHGVFIVSLDERKVLPLGDRERIIEASDPEWSPDGRSLAFFSAEKKMYDIGVFSMEEKTVTWLTNGEHECYDPVWSPLGNKIAYEVNINGNIAINLVDLGGETREVRVGPGIHSQVRFSTDGESLFFLYNGPKHPNDLWQYSLESADLLQLTNSLPASLDTSGFVSPSSVHYKSTDGKAIPALLYQQKKGYAKHAAIVYVHGGPTAQQINNWNPIIQEFLDRGFTVIAPNYRGSTGYGKEFREANRFVMGKLDLDDVAKSVQYLTENGLAEPGRIAVMGGSFGGYLTMCALTKYPDLWVAGSALLPFLNWFTEIQNERDDLQYWDRQNMGDPDKDKERLREASPIFFIEKIKAPLQLIAGAHDPRCPVSETIQARDTLRSLGKEAEVIIYEDEGHGFRKLINRVDANKKMINFLHARLNR